MKKILSFIFSSLQPFTKATVQNYLPMRRCLILFSVLMGVSAYGQTNTFPASGNVGIGVANPDVNLHVWEPSGSMPGGVVAPTKSVFKLSRTGTNGYSWNEGAEFRIGHGGPSGSGSQLDLYINGLSNQNSAPDQQAMTWLYNGNVGIGTSAPGAKLMVSNGGLVLGANSIVTNKDGHLSIGNIHENSTPRINNNSWVDSTTFLLSAQNYSTIGFHQSGARVDFIRVGSGTIQLGYDGGWGVANVGLPQGIWNAQGNVGIGTTNPTTRLAVNGIIRAQEIKVEAANWPDYVFAPEYQLPSLESLSAQIKTHGHLPNIPCAEEVSKNGIALGEMNRKLLEKVEELTLYVIKQNEESQTLKTESMKQKELLQKQSDLIEKLQQRIERLENKK